MKTVVLVIAVVVALLSVVLTNTDFNKDESAASPATAPSKSTQPAPVVLSAQAMAGMQPYNRSCAGCHGEAGIGTKLGPPLMHKVYNPGHHADESFVRAVRNGVRQHHWQFGDMPPRPEVTDEEIALIVRFVRELQVSQGIVYEQHRM